MPSPSAAYSQLAAYLAEHERPYYAVAPIGGQRAHVRFLGVLQGQPVAWDAEVLTLLVYYQEQVKNLAPGEPARSVRSFIEVGAHATQGVTLGVGLAVALIDEPTVLRTIIMIRNYKRLRPGRHEFGAALTFNI